MVVAEQHDTQTENYANVLETSRLRPDVEPFVPKSSTQNGQPYYVVSNNGFSLDAPEFIPNVYASNGEMYTWVPNQFIVAPATNHPRFSIPRFRDKFIRQHRNRNNNNNNNNNRQGYNNNNSHNGNRYENNDHRDSNGYQHRVYNKIEQRNNKSRDHHHNNNNGTSQSVPQKQIKIEKKKDRQDTKDKSNNNNNNNKGKAEVIDEVLVPVVVPEIDEGVMSYRAALVGNTSTPIKQDPNNTDSKAKVEGTKTDIDSTERPSREDKLSRDEKSRDDRPAREDRPPRSDRRNEKFVPADSEQAYSKPHYNGRGGGRPKPTKGSEIQLNIFSLVQDKKSKKKKLPRAKDDERETINKAANPLDSTAPAVKRGKEREEGKPKKLSKMKKIIVKEKLELSENGEETKTTVVSVPEFCRQSVTPELNSSLSAFLSQLREYNDKAYRTGSSHKRRYCCGLREARKYLKLNKVKCIIIPPNIDKIVSKGGLYDCVHDIVHLSSEQNVPIFYGLNKTKISKILARPKSTITSAVSVFSYHGAEVLWQDVLHNATIARERFASEAQDTETLKEGDVEEGSSDEGEEFEDDNNEEEDTLDLVNESADNDSVSSSLVDSGIENNEISSLSLENGHTSGEG